MVHFGSFWLTGFLLFWFIWLILVHLVSFAYWILAILVNFGPFWSILVNWVHFGSFWLTGFSRFWFILVNWVHFGSVWLTGFSLFLITLLKARKHFAENKISIVLQSLFKSDREKLKLKKINLCTKNLVVREKILVV